MITTVFISKCALWQNKGKGKLKPRFVTSLESSGLSISRGWRFIFLLAVWETDLLSRQHHGCVLTQPGSGQPLSPGLQMACKQPRCEFWAEVCHHSGGGGWGQPNLSVWEAESCQDTQRQLLLMSLRSAQPSEKWWEVLGVTIILCLSNSFQACSGASGGSVIFCVRLGSILAYLCRTHAATVLCSFHFCLSILRLN